MASRAEGKDLDVLLAEAVAQNNISVFDRLGIGRDAEEQDG